MSDRARELALQFHQVQEEVLSFARELSDAQWRIYVPNEQQSVAASIHHISIGYRAEGAVIKALATQAALPEAFDAWQHIHSANAEGAAEYDAVRKDVALERLERYGDKMVAMIEQLSDEQLQRSQYLGLAERDITTDQFVTSFVLTHPTEHLANCRQAIENDVSTS